MCWHNDCARSAAEVHSCDIKMECDVCSKELVIADTRPVDHRWVPVKIVSWLLGIARTLLFYALLLVLASAAMAYCWKMFVTLGELRVGTPWSEATAVEYGVRDTWTRHSGWLPGPKHTMLGFSVLFVFCVLFGTLYTAFRLLNCIFSPLTGAVMRRIRERQSRGRFAVTATTRARSSAGRK